MGTSTRHIVMVGLDVGTERNPYNLYKEAKKWEDWEKQFVFLPEAKSGDFVYVEDYYSKNYGIFGKLLEMSADGRWDTAYLEVKPRVMTDEDWWEVKEAAERIFDIKNADPKLYAFTHFS